jgi:hypothetical protein
MPAAFAIRRVIQDERKPQYRRIRLPSRFHWFPTSSSRLELSSRSRSVGALLVRGDPTYQSDGSASSGSAGM